MVFLKPAGVSLLVLIHSNDDGDDEEGGGISIVFKYPSVTDSLLPV